MFDDPEALDGLFRLTLALLAAAAVVNTAFVALVAWGLRTCVRRAGRAGGRIAAFVVTLGAEVLVLAVFTTWPDEPTTGARALLSLAAVTVGGWFLLQRPNPADDAGQPAVEPVQRPGEEAASRGPV
ncbi:MAG: hypothetical protein WCC60_05005 [Ilumatobacteraceae bacterium]